MALEQGCIVEGKVTGITKFGAFVALPEGKSGLVHISEIANSFVSDVHEHVQMGQTVKVRVMSRLIKNTRVATRTSHSMIFSWISRRLT